ncbi:hypothetical protein [Coleofasciculus sp. G2-EDA-02]|uniref:hypothetical protein n=1 Tax=Coleofasciculus sp. G2-EDA-02 TaxID=3069529 RepID=UPI0032F3F419
MLRKITISIAVAALIMFGGSTTAQASTLILESVPFDSVDTGSRGGTDVDADQFLGWRFDLNSRLNVTDIGGTFFGFSSIPNRNIFGAIISLNGIDALPLGNPFLPEEVLAVTTLTTPIGHNDLLTPLEVRLEPGNYALVFGSGLFGATGSSVMSFLQGSPRSSSVFFWDVDTPPLEARWVNTVSPNRFVIVGSTSVPETSPVLSFLCVVTLGFGSALLRRHQGKDK